MQRLTRDPRRTGGGPSGPHRFRREPWFVSLVRAFGWRAYVVPVLIAITAWLVVDAIVDHNGGASPSSVHAAHAGAAEEAAREHDGAGAGHGGAHASASHGPDPAEIQFPVSGAELPPGGPFTEAGDGTYHVVGTPGMRAGDGEKRTIRYVIEVENGLDPVQHGGDDAFAALVDATLSHPKGWIADKAFAFEHVAPDANPDIRIQLTSVQTTHHLCGADLGLETSCFTSDGNRVVINQSRWIRGAFPFAGDVGGYRRYVINHEVGHGIGYGLHEACGRNGALAPVMMQQTISLSNAELFRIDPTEVYPDNENVCRYNPWPYPAGRQ